MNDDKQPIHLVIGPVGAGKTTWARREAQRRSAVRFDLDDWMARLFRPDRPDTGDRIAWYVERAARCVEQIWQVALEVVHAGRPVVLELGLVRRAEREAFYQQTKRAGQPLAVTWLDVDRNERRSRVERRNAERGETFSMVVPPAVFELASDLWEPPNADEVARMRITTLRPTSSSS